MKLGKGKKQPTNAVDTTFKARCSHAGNLMCTNPLMLTSSYRASVPEHNKRQERPSAHNETEADLRGLDIPLEAPQS